MLETKCYAVYTLGLKSNMQCTMDRMSSNRLLLPGLCEVYNLKPSETRTQISQCTIVNQNKSSILHCLLENLKIINMFG